jgi:4-hydroxybutyrate CoA-transferase
MTRNWQEDYKRKLTTADEAVKAVKSGDAIYIHGNAACPETILDALMKRADSLRNVSFIPVNSLGRAEYVKPQYRDSFLAKIIFVGANSREAINAGRAGYVPMFLGELPMAMETGKMPIDVCFFQLSPPDCHGFCSLGTAVDCALGARKHARLIIAEINKQMPRTLGRTQIHVSSLDHIVEVDRPLPEYVPGPLTPENEAMGRFVADLVEDEATIQLGIGAIPDAVLKFLGNKKNLGVHSEMVSDGIVDLIEQGVITNEAKTVLPGKTAVAFVIGTRKLYDFVHDNPSVEFQPCSFINDPFVISRNHKMTAINSALLVDLTGQVGSDSMGSYIYSGFGGQVDFVRGACGAEGGKAIIALPATAKNGTVSRITPFLPQGTGVVTSRADVDYIVTEFGVARLFGRTLQERAKALIGIAHPKFRDELLAEVKKISWMGS